MYACICTHMYTYIHVEIYSITCYFLYTHLYCSKTVCSSLTRTWRNITTYLLGCTAEELNQVILQYYYNNF